MSGKDGATAPDLVEDAVGYVTEYAKSNRSTCQVCKEKIDKGLVRLGVEVVNPYRSDGGTMPLWGHPECIFKKLKKPGKPGKKTKLTSVEDIKGFEELKEKDQKELKKRVDDHASAVSNVPKDDDWTELVKEGQFWKIACLDNLTHTAYGNRNDRGAVLSMVKEHDTEQEAEAYMEKMMADKIKKGYCRIEDEDPVWQEEKKEQAKEEKKEESKEEEEESTPDVYGFQVEYAKSNRSRCKGCNEKIDKGAVRIAKLIDNPYVQRKDPDVPVKMPVWYEVECFFANQRKGGAKKTRLVDAEELEGLEALKEADQQLLRERIESETKAMESFESPKKGTASSTTGGSSVPADQVYLEATEGDNNKWWGITQNDKTTKTRWGELDQEDDDGHFVLKQFDTPDEATAYLKKMVTSKLKGSYELIAIEGVKIEKDDRENRALEFVPEKKSPKRSPKKSPAKKTPAKRRKVEEE